MSILKRRLILKPSTYGTLAIGNNSKYLVKNSYWCFVKKSYEFGLFRVFFGFVFDESDID